MQRQNQRSPIVGFDAMELPYRHGDGLFIVALIVLCALGLLMVFSASFFKAEQNYGDPYYFLKEHASRLGIGALLFLFAYRIDYHRLRSWSRWNLLLWLGILGIVLILPQRNGTHRWLTIFGFSIQPAEFARIALVIYLADWCSRHANLLEKSWGALAKALGFILLPVALVVVEPSFSEAAMIAATGGLMLFFAGAKIQRLLVALLPAIPAAVVAFILEPYRILRLLSFPNPEADPRGAGYHVLQSLIAVGSGQITGLGLGMSGQKFAFLPEAHCDFIFAILCEELGFIGAVAALFIFFTFIWRGTRIALRAPDPFGFLLAAGLLFSMVLFAVVNISVTLGIIPVTGLPLPFISYGGSALIVNLISCGIIMNISRHAQSPESI